MPEDYVHRIGRTGRAGREGEAVSLVSPEDRPLMAAIERLINRQVESRVIEGFEPGTRGEPRRIKTTPGTAAAAAAATAATPRPRPAASPREWPSSSPAAVMGSRKPLAATAAQPQAPRGNGGQQPGRRSNGGASRKPIAAMAAARQPRRDQAAARRPARQHRSGRAQRRSGVHQPRAAGADRRSRKLARQDIREDPVEKSSSPPRRLSRGSPHGHPPRFPRDPPCARLTARRRRQQERQRAGHIACNTSFHRERKEDSVQQLREDHGPGIRPRTGDKVAASLTEVGDRVAEVGERGSKVARQAYQRGNEGARVAYDYAMSHPKATTAVVLGAGIAAGLLWMVQRNGGYAAIRRKVMQRSAAAPPESRGGASLKPRSSAAPVFPAACGREFARRFGVVPAPKIGG